MSDSGDSLALQKALDTCAAEPVHIPGTVQPFACLLALDPESRIVRYASENTVAFLGREADELLGKDAAQFLPRKFWHAVNNMRAIPSSVTELKPLCGFELGEHDLFAHGFLSGGLVVVEISHEVPSDFGGTKGVRLLGQILRDIEACDSEPELLRFVTDFFRHLTGYDRVMIYRFDASFNGEVLAENRRNSLPSFVGLRFPHWDIPPQAREMMKKLPVRVIADVAQTPVRLRVSTDAAAPLDISLAASRGVSAVHMEYLKNMGVAATMTLTLMVDKELWGIVSFHHMAPRVPPVDLLEILTQSAQMISTKLLTLQQKAHLRLVSEVDELEDVVSHGLDDFGAFDSFADKILEVMEADGLIVKQGSSMRRRGLVPDASLLTALQEKAGESQEVVHFERLREVFPELDNALNGCAGAIAFGPDEDRCLFVFRKEELSTVSWAGNPEKTIETVANQPRLSPRGSFSVYVEETKGMSKSWTDRDLYFADRFWTLFNSVERTELISSLNRQQKIMIDELNHRVRNIMALVRSVSEQARSVSHGTLDTYSKSLEARIEALAASHDLASGDMTASVPLMDLIHKEFEPFQSAKGDRVIINGDAPAIEPQSAPIFSLVIHELVTNAVKYGALSDIKGKVRVVVGKIDGFVTLDWTEEGGPAIARPERLGFGTTLIEQAVPYELQGDSELTFAETGVVARFKLPDKLFKENSRLQERNAPPERLTRVGLADVAKVAAGKTCLLVEDSYVIAKSMRDILENLGVEEVQIEATTASAIEYLQHDAPDFAILDVNLGEETSENVAEALSERGLPFLFVTGYGDSTQYSAQYTDKIKLTKPVARHELGTAIYALLRSVAVRGQADG